MLFGAWDDARAQGVMACEETVVPNGVGTRWRNQGAQAREKGVRGHLGVGGPGAGGLLEVHADLTVRGALDGILSERRPEQIAAQPLELAAPRWCDAAIGTPCTAGACATTSRRTTSALPAASLASVVH